MTCMPPILCLLYRHVRRLLQSLTSRFTGTFGRLWYRWAPCRFHGKSHVHQNPFAFFTADGCTGDLAQLWCTFDFEDDMPLLRRLSRKFGSSVVFRTVDSFGKTVSHWIAESGTAEALIYVAKCEPSLVDSWRNDRTFPLVHLALLNNNLEVLDCLVHDFGLSASLTDSYDLNAMIRSITLSMQGYGFQRPQETILRCFVYGIDVNSQTPEGLTALHLAVQAHSLQSVRLLLWLGANITLVDRRGCTPFDYALHFGNLQLARLLSFPDRSYLASLSWSRRLYLYYRLVRTSSGARCAELRFWLGASILLFQLALIFGYLIPTYFFNYFDVSSKILPVHIFLTASILFSVYAVYCTVFKDSGFIPIGTNEYFELMRYLASRDSIPANRCRTLDYLRWERGAQVCHVCQCIAPSKAKHCYHCARCCLDYDHHCVFLFTCIGRANVGHFLAFTSGLTVSGLTGLFVIAWQSLEEISTYTYYTEYFTVNGYFSWASLLQLYRVMDHNDHFLEMILCVKLIVIGLTLGLVTLGKVLYFARKRANLDSGDGTNSKVPYF